MGGSAVTEEIQLMLFDAIFHLTPWTIAFTRVFYRFFLRGEGVVDEETGEKTVKLMSIGEALRATRWFFLKECNNPLGLAYGLYSPAHYQLARSPRMERE